MRNVPCPNCSGMLGVPNKLRGLPVECPVCKLEFVPGSSANKSGTNTANVSSKTKKSPKPSLRSVPLPASISSEPERAKAETAKTETLKNVGVNLDHLLPPTKARLNTISPDPIPVNRNADCVEPTVHRGSELSGTVDDRSMESQPQVEAENARSQPDQSEKPAIARIIRTEQVLPQLTKDGKLPTLQLVDQAKPKPKDGELKSNPVFVGLLVCFSLVTSGIMIFVVGMQPSNIEDRIIEARASIREFYEVRADEEVAPYQRELREAQLANSRGDYRAEIDNYEKVMARFHAEDRNKFKGLTGSPTGDVELEEHVSVLLNESKRRLKKGL